MKEILDFEKLLCRMGSAFLHGSFCFLSESVPPKAACQRNERRKGLFQGSPNKDYEEKSNDVFFTVFFYLPVLQPVVPVKIRFLTRRKRAQIRQQGLMIRKFI